MHEMLKCYKRAPKKEKKATVKVMIKIRKNNL